MSRLRAGITVGLEQSTNLSWTWSIHRLRLESMTRVFAFRLNARDRSPQPLLQLVFQQRLISLALQISDGFALLIQGNGVTRHFVSEVTAGHKVRQPALAAWV